MSQSSTIKTTPKEKAAVALAVADIEDAVGALLTTHALLVTAIVITARGKVTLELRRVP